MKILAIYGALREKSYNKALLAAAQKLVPEGMELELLDPGAQFPLYNQDVQDKNFPSVVTEYKNKIRAADGILISTPEYNRGMPGVLKNMIDWCSRPFGDNAWGNKPYAVMSASNGRLSAMRANYEAKLTMMQMGGHVMGSPEIFVGPGADVFDADMNLKDEKVKEVLTKFLAAFKSHIEQLKK